LRHADVGIVLHGQVPDAWTLGREAIVILSGLYLFSASA
jgi:hypothetical protein